MAVDAQTQVVINEMAEAAGKRGPVELLTPQESRQNPAIPREPGPEVARVHDHLIPGPRGEIRLRVYTPTEGNDLPVLVWFHDGGPVWGSIEQADGTCRRLAVGADCIVASVDYPYAPENEFPASVEACHAAVVWALHHASDINGDSSRVAVGGNSGGGNLCAASALMTRDRGGPQPIFQLLVVPVLDRDIGYRSCLEYGIWHQLTINNLLVYWKHYLRNEADGSNPYAVPMMAKDLAGLPSTLVITAECDPVRDYGEAYAQRLKGAGVPTTLSRYPETFHLFFEMAGRIDKGKLAIAEACNALRQAFAPRITSKDSELAEKNKAVVRQLFEEVLSKGNFDLADEIIDPNLASDPPMGKSPGAAGLKEVIALDRQACVDRRDVVEDLIAEGDKVVARVTWYGTHTGEFQGVAPTGKKVSVKACHIFRVKNGKIVEARWCANLLELMRQVGAFGANPWSPRR